MQERKRGKGGKQIKEEVDKVVSRPYHLETTKNMRVSWAIKSEIDFNRLSGTKGRHHKE